MDSPKQPVVPPSLLDLVLSYLKRSPPHHLFYLLMLYFLPSILIMVLHVKAFHHDELPTQPAVTATALEAGYYKKPGCYWIKIDEEPRDVFGHPGDTVAYVMEGEDRKVARFNQSSYTNESATAHAWLHAQGLHECDPSHKWTEDKK
jgi:hypothetical protein